MSSVDGGVRKCGKPISLHGDDIGPSREFFNHTKDESYGETDPFGRRIAQGKDDEPSNTGNQNADAVDDNSGKKYSEAGRGAVDPAA